MDVRDVVLDLSARTDRPDGRAFADRQSTSRARRAEMRQGHRIAIGRLDGHCPATDGHGARERNGARRRCGDGRACGSPDVDAPVLAGGVGVVPEHEFLEHGSLDGPCPRSSRRHDHQGGREHDDHNSTHLSLLVVLIANRATRYRRRRSLSIWTTENCRRGACAAGPSVARRLLLPRGARARRQRAPRPLAPPRLHPRTHVRRRGRARA